MDITVTLHIAKSPATVARTMFDPSRNPSWIGAVIKSEIFAGHPMVRARVRRQSAIPGQQFVLGNEDYR